MISQQGRAEEARLAHNQEAAGSNPAPATNPTRKRVLKTRLAIMIGSERVSRAVAGRSATATSEIMDATAGETAPAFMVLPSCRRGHGRRGSIGRAPFNRERPMLRRKGRVSKSKARQTDLVGAGVGQKRARGEQKARTPICQERI